MLGVRLHEGHEGSESLLIKVPVVAWGSPLVGTFKTSSAFMVLRPFDHGKFFLSKLYSTR